MKPDIRVEVYVVEMRVTKNDVVLQDWADACHGHRTQYEAMGCHDLSVSLLAGKAEPTSLMDMAIIAKGHAAIELGETIEARIIKRVSVITVTEEVLEGVFS